MIKTLNVTKHFSIAILAILLVAACFRIVGISFGLPHLYHADEPIVVHHALAFGSGDLNPHFFKIPPLISYLLFILYGFYYLLGYLLQRFPDLQSFEYLFYQDPSSFFLLARLFFGLIPGVLTVYALYRWVNSWFGEVKALTAAFLLAVCFLHVRDSHYIYVDIPLVLVLTLAYGFFLTLTKESSWKSHVLAGAFVGLATAVKYNGCFIAIPYIILSFERRCGWKNLRHWMIAGAASFAIYLCLNPYSLLDVTFFLDEMRSEASAHAGGVPWLYHISYSLAGAVGWPALILFISACFRSSLYRDKRRLAALIFCLVYYGVLVTWGQPYARYVLPLLPFVLFILSDFIIDLAQKFKAPSARVFLFVFLLAAPSIVKDILLLNILSAKDVRTLSTEWVESHVPSGARLALDIPFYMPRLNQDIMQSKEVMEDSKGHFSELLKRRLDLMQLREPRPAYRLYKLTQTTAPHSLEELRVDELPYGFHHLTQTNIDYVIITRLWEKDLNDNFYNELDEKAELVAEFTPYRSSVRKWPYQHPLTGAPFQFRDLWERSRNGQPLKIYRLSQKED